MTFDSVIAIGLAVTGLVLLGGVAYLSIRAYRDRWTR